MLGDQIVCSAVAAAAYSFALRHRHPVFVPFSCVEMCIRDRDYPVVSINLEAGHTYLVLAHITASIGSASLLVCSIHVDSGGTLFGGGSNYSTMDSGGGTTGYAIVTCNSDAVCTLYSYGYFAEPYNVTGDMAAIQLR